MKPQEELDLILKLIKKYELPLSPILEYAINEKKEEFPCDIVPEDNAEDELINTETFTLDLDDIENVMPVDFESMYDQRHQLLLTKMKSFVKARSPQYIAKTINQDEWGGSISVEEIDTLLKLMPEVEYVPFGLYKLKS